MQDNGTLLDIKFKYHSDYIQRIKRIPDIKFDRANKKWTMSASDFEHLERIFKGELVFLTPRHKITGDSPPLPPDWYKEIPTDEITGLKLKLFPYQTFGANFLLYRLNSDRYAMLCDDVGLGKTPQAIAAAKILKDQGKIKRVLVVCLSGAKTQWKTDGVDKFTDMTCEVIKSGTKKQRLKLYESAKHKDIIVINYQLLLHDFEQIQALNCDMIIFDEIHKIPNHTAKMNKAATKLKAKYKIALTGTPLMNRPEDIYGVFNVMKHESLGKITQFRNRYLNLAFNGYTTELVGCKNLDELRERISKFWIRRTAEDVGIQMPENMPPIYHYVEPDSHQIELHQELRAEMNAIQASMKELTKKVAWERSAEEEEQTRRLSNKFKTIFSMLIAASDSLELFSMSKTESIREKYGNRYANMKISPKLTMCKQLVQEIVENSNKVVIFTQFERMTRILLRELEQYGKCVVYHGAMDDDERTEARNSFRDESSDGAKIFIATDAASNSLNLQSARYVINYDLPWNPATVTQRTGRIRRVDSKFDSVFTLNLVTLNTIDESIVDALQSKRDLFHVLIENTDEERTLIKHLTEEAVQ